MLMSAVLLMLAGSVEARDYNIVDYGARNDFRILSNRSIPMYKEKAKKPQKCTFLHFSLEVSKI